jgi:chromosome segregation ATPase
VVSHERYVEELTRDFEQRSSEERQSRVRLEEEKQETHKELAETQAQLEDDVDTEIENMRRTFEDNLMAFRETTLKYKGENGIMKKKYAVMQKELEEQKEEMRALQEKERDLHDQIKMLEKEVSAHKKEIKTRDATINEKEKRIYELKKKNQELDKFKFVLDYKIRELKQQVEPRQQEIVKMRDHIKDMDAELEKYHSSNASLDGMIGVLRGRIDTLQEKNKSTRMKAKQQENAIEGFRGDVQMAVAHILDPSLLREEVVKLVEMHGSHGDIKPRMDPDVEGEYGRHKEFLQRSMGQLKKSLAEGTSAHMETNNQLMQQNMGLIGEINRQRDTNKALKHHVQAEMGRLRHLYQNISIAARSSRGGGGGKPRSAHDSAMQALRELTNEANNAESEDPAELSDQLYRNRQRILALRAAIAELEGRRGPGPQRLYSREALPPIDGASLEQDGEDFEVTKSQSVMALPPLI